MSQYHSAERGMSAEVQHCSCSSKAKLCYLSSVVTCHLSRKVAHGLEQLLCYTEEQTFEKNS
jgi:hypothetical protein